MKSFNLINIFKLLFLVLVALINSCSKNNSSTNPDIEVITEQNSPPVITSTPITVSDHNREYKYIINVDDEDGDEISLNVSAPSWLNFNNVNKTLSGTADWNNIGSFDISIEASDGNLKAEQNFKIVVNVGEIICDSDFGNPANSLYILPFQVGKTYKNIQSYCPPNPAWGHHNWFAYDFDMNIRDTIIAMRAGTVIATEGQYIDANRQSGKENYIFILHKDGSVASYYHLTKNGPLVGRGEKVKQGEVIGLSGDTGASIGPHLHVAVYRGRTNYSRQYTLPINFRNSEGPLNSHNGLIYQGNYEALNFTSNDN